MSNQINISLSTSVLSKLVPNGPTPRDLLNKVKSLQEIKKIFSSVSSMKSTIPVGKGISATQAALGIEKKTLKEVIDAKPGNFEKMDESTITKIKELADSLLKNEMSFPDALVCYHGNQSSFLPDVFGSLKNVLTIGEWGADRPLPRLESCLFEKSVEELIGNKISIDDHNEYFRKKLIAASPTLISHIETRDLENCLVFYMLGESIAFEDAWTRLSNLLKRWSVDSLIPTSLFNSVISIETDYPQNGYIYQMFFHDPFLVNRFTYPSKPMGYPLNSETEFCTTSEFLSVLKSQNPEEVVKFQKKYQYYIDKVQLRLLVAPQLFRDKDKVAIHCHRRLSMNEEGYRKRIRQEIVDPILEAALANRGPGVFFLFTCCKNVGPGYPPFGKAC